MEKEPLIITAAATARPTISHIQLRHLLSCPQRRGIVYYVSDYAVLERNLLKPATRPRTLVNLDFDPHCFAITVLPSDPHTMLLAAGSGSSQIHISLHSLPHPSPESSPTPPNQLWSHVKRVRPPREIMNYMFFSPAELTDDTRAPRHTASSSRCAVNSTTGTRTTSDLRLVVCGNDMAVRFFDLALHTHAREEQRLQECGMLRMDTCVNHAAISPDGRTLLCVGDTPRAYLFRIIPGASLAFEPLATYAFPMPPQGYGGPVMPDDVPPAYATATTPTYPPTTHMFPPTRRLIAPRACFSAAWTSDGLKFAVASQEGALAVWDVRSSVPVWVFWTGVRSPNSRHAGRYETRPRRGGVAVSSWGLNAGEYDGESGWVEAEAPGPQGANVFTTAAASPRFVTPSTPLGQSSPSIAQSRGLSPARRLPSEGNNGSNADSSNTTRATGTRNMLSPAGVAVFRLPVQASAAERFPRPATTTTLGHADPPANSNYSGPTEPNAPMGLAERTGFLQAQSDADLNFDVNGPDSGIRNLQFSTGDGGRELCVFVEHTTNIHVIDARTFDPATHRTFVFPDVGELVAARAARGPDAEAAPENATPETSDRRQDTAAASDNAAEAGVRPGAETGVQMQSEDDMSTVGTRSGTPEPNSRLEAEGDTQLHWADHRRFPRRDVSGIQTSQEREREQEIASVVRPGTPEASIPPEAHRPDAWLIPEFDTWEVVESMPSSQPSAGPDAVQETETETDWAQNRVVEATMSVDMRDATPEPDARLEMQPLPWPRIGMSTTSEQMWRTGQEMEGERERDWRREDTPSVDTRDETPEPNNELVNPAPQRLLGSGPDPAPVMSQDAAGRHDRDVPRVIRTSGSRARVHSNSPVSAMPPRTLPGSTSPPTVSVASPSRTPSSVPPHLPRVLHHPSSIQVHGGATSVPNRRSVSQSPSPGPQAALPSVTEPARTSDADAAADLGREHNMALRTDIATQLTGGRRGALVDTLTRVLMQSTPSPPGRQVAAGGPSRGGVDSRDPRERERIVEGLEAGLSWRADQQRQRREAREAGRESGGSREVGIRDRWGGTDWQNDDWGSGGNTNSWGWGSAVNSEWGRPVRTESGNGNTNRGMSRPGNSSSWMHDAWGDPASGNARRPSDPDARRYLTEEGVVEYLDADGDVIPRDNDNEEADHENLIPTRPQSRVWGSAQENPGTAASGVVRITPPARRRDIQPILRPSPPSPFPAMVRVEPAQQLPSVVGTEPHAPHAPQIAGVCFDPTGEWVYVAGDGGIVEWRVKERYEGKGSGGGGWL